MRNLKYNVGDTVYATFFIDGERVVNKNPFKIESIEIKITKYDTSVKYILSNGIICTEENLSCDLEQAKSRCMWYRGDDFGGTCLGVPEIFACPYNGDRSRCKL